MTARSKTLRYILIHLLFFIGMGSYFSTLSPFILENYGSSSWVIFVSGQLSFPVGFFLIGYLSDRFHRLRLFLVSSLLLLAPLQFLLFHTPDNLVLAALYNGLIRFLFAFVFQLKAISAMEALGTLNFGRIRAWGTVGFLLVQLFFLLGEWGFLSFQNDSLSINARAAGQVGALLYLASAVASLRIQKRRKSSEHYFFQDAWQILRQGEVLLFLLISFFFFFSYQLVDYYLGRLLERQGGMEWVYGGWSVAVLLEIPFMTLAARFQKRDSLLFLISTMAGVIRFAWISAWMAGLEVPSLLYSQILHGIHFTGYYMGAIYWMRQIFPDHLYGTGFGAYTLFSVSLGGVTGNFLYGKLLFWKPSGELLSLFPLVGRVTGGGGREGENFFLLFFTAMLIQFVIFILFLIRREPGKKGLESKPLEEES